MRRRVFSHVDDIELLLYARTGCFTGSVQKVPAIIYDKCPFFYQYHISIAIIYLPPKRMTGYHLSPTLQVFMFTPVPRAPWSLG